MKERGILFSAPMVLALFGGIKTQTRRVARLTASAHVKEVGGNRRWHPADPEARLACPYGQPGDQLWVREAIRLIPDQEPDDGTGDVLSEYAADGSLTVADAWPWRRRYLPAMHCPRGLSRMDLEIVDVRIERLRSISEVDAKAEGAPGYEEGIDAPPSEPDSEWSYRASYRRVWETINGPGSWDENPWVWVVEFKRIES
jgi:hypothetical protein